MQVNFAITMLLTSLFSLPSFAEEYVYPVGGDLSNTNTEKPQFINFQCSPPDRKSEEVACRFTVATIEPKLEKLASIEELKEIARRDNFDVNKLNQMCIPMKPLFDFVEGKTVEGKQISEDQLANFKKRSAERGWDNNFISSFRELCNTPTEDGIIELLDMMQKAERGVCKVSWINTSDRTYKLDRKSGTFIDSGVVNGICDQYLYTEIITLDKFGLGVISKYQEVRTFIKKIVSGEDRELRNCDLQDYSDSEYVSEQTYFPLNCVSFVSE